MKKIFTFFTALILLGSMMTVQAATSTTVYYAIPSSVVGAYTVKLNVNRQGDGNNWATYTMTQTNKTYNSNPIYSCTFTDLYNGLGVLQFQLYDDNTWKSQEQPISSWTSVGVYNGKMWVYGSSSWIDYTYDGAAPVPSYTFTEGMTIYYDFTEYGGGIDVYAPGSNGYYNSTSAIIAITLSSDWKLTESTSLFQSAASSWSPVAVGTTLPEDGHNMIVSTDGIHYTWGTYVPAPPTPDTYTVVGGITGFLEWAPTDTDFDMTEDNGVYTFTLTDVTLAAQSYEYKIVKNHSYNVAYPQEGNESFQVTTAGVYDLTFTLNSNANPVEYGVTPTLKQEIVVIPTVQLYGTFADGSTWAATEEFTPAGNNESASLTLENLPAGNYQFKVVVGGSYLGNGHTFYRDYTGASGIDANTADMTLEADVAGDYTFTWTYETNALSIEFPAEPTPEYATVKFFAPRTVDNPWEHVYAYSFKGSRKFLGEWPGTEITTKDNEWYVVSVRKGSDLILHDNNGMETNKIEDIQAATCYVPTAIDTKVTIAEQCTVDYYISGTKNLTGLAEDWVVADENFKLDANNQIVFNDLATGTYEFKITNGTWAWSIGGNDHLKSGDCSSLAATAGLGNVAFAIEHKQNVTITYYPETEEICLDAETVIPIAPTASIGGKFIINQYGDTAVFSRGNLQYQQSSDTWRFAPNQYDWCGNNNLEMGNPSYEGWVDLFSWSLGVENNYGATSQYDPTLYYNATFDDWGNLFDGNEWSTLTKEELNYLIFNRPNASQKRSLAIVGDTLGIILLPDAWTLPVGLSFTPNTWPTTKQWRDEDATDDTWDHYRLAKGSMPHNVYTEAEWAQMEAAGAVFLPNAGRRSGGANNYYNTEGQTQSTVFRYSYYENYVAYYWTCTMSNAEKGQASYLITTKYLGKDSNGDDDYDWNHYSIWGENGRYGQSVRLVHISPRQYTVTYDANGAEGAVPTDENKYIAEANITLAGPGSLTKDGYKFAGWKLGDNTYDAGAQVATPRSVNDVVFVAQWELDYQIVRENLDVNRYYTVCLPKKVIAIKGASFWTLQHKSADGATAFLEEETNNLPFAAGKPFIIQATADKLEVAYEGDAATTGGSNGALRGTLENMDAAALAAAATAEESVIYMLFSNELRPVGTNNHLDANRAYVVLDDLTVDTPTPAPGKRVRSMPMQKDAATGLEDVQGDNVQSTKVLLNGNLYILRGEKVYDVTGRLVK